MHKKNPAFTLIELLVVISIIAVLMAIMMPALAKVREQAKTTICKTRLKDIGNAVGIYSNDYPDKLPDSQWYYCRWMHKLAPYYGIASEGDDTYSTWGVYSWKIYRCPTQEKYAPDRNTNFATGKGAGGIFGYNRFFTAEANAQYFMWRKFSTLKNVASLPLFGDTNAEVDVKYGQYGGGMHYGGAREVFPHFSALEYGWEEANYVNNLGPAFNHAGKMNHLMADLHCETFGMHDWQLDTNLTASGLPGWANIFHPINNVGIYPPTRDEKVEPEPR